MLDHCHLGQFVGDEEQMRKNGSVLAVQPMKNLDRQFDLDSARDVKKCAGGNERLMQRGEFCSTEHGRLRHEMFPKQIGMLEYCTLQRLKDDSAFLQLLGDDVALKQLITGENNARRHVLEAA